MKSKYFLQGYYTKEDVVVYIDCTSKTEKPTFF